MQPATPKQQPPGGLHFLDGAHGLAYNVIAVKITDRPKAGKETNMKKLWKVTVNEFGWRSPEALYFESREGARKAWAEHTAADGVEYAGRFSDKHAAYLLSDAEDRYAMISDDDDLRRWALR